jgi:uncharacterized membrane protein YdjX (TVP38/TMEM64 family)
MDSFIFDLLPIHGLQASLAAPFGEMWIALVFLAITASAYASGIPGTLLPISFTSGALLGVGLGAVAVAAGVMIGSMILYHVLERGSQATIRQRYGHKLARLDALAAGKGIVPLIMLRLAGLPHIAVTGLCALANVGPRRYAIATAIGVLPSIGLSSLAGSAL